MLFIIIVTLFCCNNVVFGLEYSRIVDLTWDFGNDTVYWLGVQPFQFTKIIGKRVQLENGSYWYAVNEFCAGEHGGTHLDAPYHFNYDGIKVADIPVEKLIVPGVLIDLSNETEVNGASTQLEVKHLEEWKNEHGSFEENTVVLIKFGWSKYYSDKRTYLGLNHDNTTVHFPAVSPEAAKWLMSTNKITGIGLDTPGADSDLKTITHQLLTSKQMYILENVKLTEKLPVRNFTLLVMPMKISEGTGAPLRLIALTL